MRFEIIKKRGMFLKNLMQKSNAFTPVKFSKHLMGFTLIELMITTVIIAILTVVVVLNLDSARKSGRDAQRKSDLSRIGLAMNNYKTENKSHIITLSGDTRLWKAANSSNLSGLVNAGFLPEIPVDPINDSSYFYRFMSDGIDYKLEAKGEGLKHVNTSGDCTNEEYATAKEKAGDYFNPFFGFCEYLQVSSSDVAQNWN